MINPYEILGLSEDASLDEIKKTFRELSKKYHPDKNQGDKISEEKFKKISEAYDMINSEQKIKQYKNRGTGLNWDQDFENIFSDFFKFRNGSPFGATRVSYVTMHVTLEEIFNGTIKNFNYKIANTCKNCGGTGGTSFNNFGKIVHVCQACNGRGSKEEIKSTRVIIPKSLDDGAQIVSEDPSVIVTVRQMPHNNFQRNGFNVVSEETIPLVSVFEGSDVDILTLHGQLKVTIPKFSQTGSLLRVRGKGLLDPRINSYGDHIIKLKIEIPQVLTDSQCKKIVSVLKNEEEK